MVDRHFKFLEYIKGLYPEIVIPPNLGGSSTIEDFRNTYSQKVFLLLFTPDEEIQAPLYINSSSIWLRSAALFRLSNPL